MDDLNPPAITQPAEKDEKWDLDAKAAIGFARHGAKNLAQAGAALLRAKMACPPLMWLKTLAKHEIAPRTAQRWFRAFAVYAKANAPSVAHLCNFFEQLAVTPTQDEKEVEREPGEDAELHPALSIILCKDCQRKGPARDCKKCLDARSKFISKAGGKSGKSKRSKAGRVKFDWKEFDKSLVKVYPAPERIAKAWPTLADTPEHHEATRLLTQLAELFKKLRTMAEGA